VSEVAAEDTSAEDTTPFEILEAQNDLPGGNEGDGRVEVDENNSAVPFKKCIYTLNKFWNYVDDYLQEACSAIRRFTESTREEDAEWTK
jgi:hypothetical protein